MYKYFLPSPHHHAIHSFILISLWHDSMHYYTHDSCYLLSCPAYLQFIAIFYFTSNNFKATFTNNAINAIYRPLSQAIFFLSIWFCLYLLRIIIVLIIVLSTPHRCYPFPKRYEPLLRPFHHHVIPQLTPAPLPCHKITSVQYYPPHKSSHSLLYHCSCSDGLFQPTSYRLKHYDAAQNISL